MLDVVVRDHVDVSATTFAGRFHLLMETSGRTVPVLDSDLRASNGWPVADCSIPLPSFISTRWNIRRVLVVENRDVFLWPAKIPGTSGRIPDRARHLLSYTTVGFGSRDRKSCIGGDCDEAGYGIPSSYGELSTRAKPPKWMRPRVVKWKHLASRARGIVRVKHIGL